VLTTITDKKIPVENNGAIDHYVADITSATDYYPFGSPMDGRNFSSDKYRFGFNGKENDNEMKSIGNSLDFGARIYDSRIGRWLSLDPLQAKYPDLTPYNFSANNSIFIIDPDGKRILIANGGETYEYDGKTKYESQNLFILNAISAIEQAKSYGGTKTIMKVVNNEQIVTIVEMPYEQTKTEGVEFDDSDPKDVKIRWNARAGVKDAFSGRILKSGRGLFLELIHTKHFFKNKKQMDIDHKNRDVSFGMHNLEEYKTIIEENKVYGDEPNEGGKRTSHEGYFEESPTPYIEEIDTDIKSPSIDSNTTNNNEQNT
jgi:RHS repeat-associated protein